MKLIIIFTMFSLVSAYASSSYSQETKLTLNSEKITLKDLFTQIERNSEFIFVYYDNIVDLNKVVSVKVENETVDKVLESVLKSTDNSFKIFDRQIVITKKDSPIPAVSRPPSPPSVQQEQKRELKGTVKDEKGQTLPGVSVVVKGTTIGTITDVNGNFSLMVPMNAKILVFSFVGLESKVVPIGNSNVYNAVLAETTTGLNEVVVVGYGSQKKESIVGAIVNATGEQLAKTGATTNLARALQGQLPGVTTIQISGEPGLEDPRILIRAQGTWNNSSPLILVDGIERSMSDINISEVESISVLKDASATAVFGVKGAEGVILITTKRGTISKPKLTVNANTSLKFLSRTPDKLNSYDSYMYRNQAIEYEISVNENAWSYYQPMAIAQHYKQPQSETDKYIFPDVNWKKEQLKDFASSSQADLSVTGGTEFAKYFGAVSYSHEGDLLNSGLDNGKGYKSGVAYNRFNFRSNLDFNITKSTSFTVNLSGIVGTKTGGYQNTASAVHYFWDAFYFTSPAGYPIKYPDGAWGYSPLTTNPNPLMALNNSGRPKYVRTQVTTDFALNQKLDFITKGLSAKISLSYDNRFFTNGGMTDPSGAVVKYINPAVLDKLPGQTEWDYTDGTLKTNGINDFDWVMQPLNYLSENSADLGSAYRRLFYQGQINYSRQFNKNDLGITALVNREEYAQGSMFPKYREDWVGRVTYNYDGKYLFETNGAYNGSENFGPKYRFGFFPSVAIGWMASNEKFLKREWLDKLKLRYSIGKTGNDKIGDRWPYMDNYDVAAAADRTYFGNTFTASPYVQNYQEVIGNPDLHWEVSKKQNLGLELAVLKNKLNLNIDAYTDDRTDIFMSGAQRSVPQYFGYAPVPANLGITKSKGYEIELKYQSNLSKEFTYWLGWTYTHSIDKIIYKEDPVLLAAYQKKAGFQIDQATSQLAQGYLNNWDEVYTSVGKTGNAQKLPGDCNMIDYNGDGIMDTYDVVPYGFPERPQNTYTFSFGGAFKGFSAMVQFYGVYNVTRTYGWYMYGFSDELKTVVFENMVDSWRPWNTDAGWNGQRLLSSGDNANRLTVDGSYLRLKNAEIAYTFSGQMMKKWGVSSTRVYLNGNNLLYWSKMMDDRETNNVTNGAAYPMFGTVTLGLRINF